MKVWYLIFLLISFASCQTTYLKVPVSLEILELRPQKPKKQKVGIEQNLKNILNFVRYQEIYIDHLEEYLKSISN